MEFYILIFSSAVLGITLGACPSEFVEHGSSCYYLSRVGVNWDAARDKCVKYGADLADIESKQESTFIYSLIAAANTSVWLGARRDDSNVWHWVRSGRNLTFTDWNPGEPNRYGNLNEDCLESVAGWNMRWNDVVCPTVRGYVCESRAISTDHEAVYPENGIGK